MDDVFTFAVRYPGFGMFYYILPAIFSIAPVFRETVVLDIPSVCISLTYW